MFTQPTLSGISPNAVAMLLTLLLQALTPTLSQDYQPLLTRIHIGAPRARTGNKIGLAVAVGPSLSMTSVVSGTATSENNAFKDGWALET